MIRIKPNFLFVDDDKDYFKTMERFAKRKDVTIKNYSSGEEALVQLAKYPNFYQGIILDFNCVKKKSDNKTPSPQFLAWIEPKIYAISKSIPKVVLSGNPHADQQSNFNETKFFKKNKDEEKCLDYLKEEAEKLHETKVKNEYSEIFEIFDKNYLGVESYQRLFVIIEGLQADKLEEIQRNLITFRQLMDDIHKAMAKAKNDVIPIDLLDPDIKTGDILQHLKKSGVDGSKSVTVRGRPNIRRSAPALFGSLIKSIVDGVSAHQDEATFYVKKPTRYTYHAIFYAMVEYLLWFKDWMDKNANKNN